MTDIKAKVASGGALESPPSWLLARRSNSICGFFDQRCHRLRIGHVNGMTAGNLSHGGTGSLGHEALRRNRNHLVIGHRQVPTGLSFPGRIGDRTAEAVDA